MKGLEFYSAAAQIIPLLLILLAFQAPSFARKRFLKWGAAWWVVTFAFWGETCALVALYSEDAPLLFPVVVSLALIMLCVVALAIALAPSRHLLSMRPPTERDAE